MPVVSLGSARIQSLLDDRDTVSTLGDPVTGTTTQS